MPSHKQRCTRGYIRTVTSSEVQYLADEKTGKPQHTYALDRGQAYGGAEPCMWMGQGQHDSRTTDKKPELRWEGVLRRVHNLGHTHYPKLHPEVTVLASSLPKDRVNRCSCQLLYLAWLQAGMHCPVQGCEPWAALDAPKEPFLSRRRCTQVRLES
jgi:hypothetical protein